MPFLPSLYTSAGLDMDDPYVAEVAHETVTSPLNTLKEPTGAQAKQGNYKEVELGALGQIRERLSREEMVH